MKFPRFAFISVLALVVSAQCHTIYRRQTTYNPFNPNTVTYSGPGSADSYGIPISADNVELIRSMLRFADELSGARQFNVLHNDQNLPASSVPETLTPNFIYSHLLAKKKLPIFNPLPVEGGTAGPGSGVVPAQGGAGSGTMIVSPPTSGSGIGTIGQTTGGPGGILPPPIVIGGSGSQTVPAGPPSGGVGNLPNAGSGGILTPPIVIGGSGTNTVPSGPGGTVNGGSGGLVTPPIVIGGPPSGGIVSPPNGGSGGVITPPIVVIGGSGALPVEGGTAGPGSGVVPAQGGAGSGTMIVPPPTSGSGIGTIGQTTGGPGGILPPPIVIGGSGSQTVQSGPSSGGVVNLPNGVAGGIITPPIVNGGPTRAFNFLQNTNIPVLPVPQKLNPQLLYSFILAKKNLPIFYPPFQAPTFGGNAGLRPVIVPLPTPGSGVETVEQQAGTVSSPGNVGSAGGSGFIVAAPVGGTGPESVIIPPGQSTGTVVGPSAGNGGIVPGTVVGPFPIVPGNPTSGSGQMQTVGTEAGSVFLPSAQAPGSVFLPTKTGAGAQFPRIGLRSPALPATVPTVPIDPLLVHVLNKTNNLKIGFLRKLSDLKSNLHSTPQSLLPTTTTKPVETNAPIVSAAPPATVTATPVASVTDAPTVTTDSSASVTDVPIISTSPGVVVTEAPTVTTPPEVDGSEVPVATTQMPISQTDANQEITTTEAAAIFTTTTETTATTAAKRILVVRAPLRIPVLPPLPDISQVARI